MDEREKGSDTDMAMFFLAAACWCLGQPNHEYIQSMIELFLAKKKLQSRIQSCHGYFCSPWFSPWNAVPSQLREAGCKGIKPTLGNVTKVQVPDGTVFICVVVTTRVSWSSFHLWEARQLNTHDNTESVI